MNHTASVFLSILVLLLVANLGLAQVVQRGIPPFGSFGGGPFDVLNLANLNGHFAIGVRHKAGRGMPFDYTISYDTSVWYPASVNGVQTWQSVSGYGWNVPSTATGSISNQVVATQQIPCSPPGDMHLITLIAYAYYVYTDPAGWTHPFGPGWTWFSDDSCSAATGGGESSTALDGSGYVLTIAAWTGAVTVTGPDGRIYLGTGTTTGTTTDANGNQITVNANNGTFTDTLGTVALTETGSNPITLQYTAPNGQPANWKVNSTNYTVQTNFGCSGVAEFHATNVPLITSIVLPDSTRYQFTYEQTQGQPSGTTTARLAQITLPAGGTITYTYPTVTVNNVTYNGINCADGTPPTSASAGGNASLTRTVSGSGTWSYYRTQLSGNHWQTKVTTPPDPVNQNCGQNCGDDTVIDFQEDANTGYTGTYNYFETQRLTYQGSSGSGTLLRTGITCYNTANPTPSTCPTASISTSITRVTAFSYLPDTTTGKAAETDTQYAQISDPAFPTEIDSYDFGTTGGTVGSLIRKVINQYAGYGNTVRLTSSVVEDNNGATKALTTFGYDGSALSTPSGTTPQWTNVTGGRGNLTSITRKVSPTVSLYNKLTYFNTGMLNTATDWGTSSSGGPNSTTYSYNNSGIPSPSCGNSFPTTISPPLSLSTTLAWDCNGGVSTSTTDPNNQTSTVYYAQTSSYGTPDPNFWRPYAKTDQLTNVTTISYPDNTNDTVIEGAMLFNSNNSVTDVRLKFDSFGRPILNEVKEAPTSSTYDSTQTDYDLFGRASKTYMPFTNTNDSTCSGTCPGATNAYDALGRPLTITDGGGGTITLTYMKNDVLQVIGPAPSGEHTKQKQFEYDGLGRLISVCEITSVTGSGTCNQTGSPTKPTGFYTVYSYDVLGNLIGVTQNAQSSSTQSRTYGYDELSRLTSETNPESGTATYTYDSFAANYCTSLTAYTSAGDLVASADANGNHVCYHHDTVHRITDVYNNNESITNPCKRFRYDATNGVLGSIPSGVTVKYPLGRVAEAETDTCASPITQGSIITDEWSSYSVRGELTDVYEYTPHSGAYYHTTATYWANGAVNTLGGVPGQSTWTYGVEGEGRPQSAMQGSNSWVTSTTYTTASQPLVVTFLSGDNDTFTYDANTGRMTNAAFTIGSTPKTFNVAPTWNPNGTLGQLVITDPFNSSISQTCAYSHDDLARLAGVNCSSSWSQNFTYDAFGNITKAVPGGDAGQAWNPGYNSNNQYSLTGTSYDSDGNLLNDSFHNYSWDSYGNPSTIDAITCGSNGTCLTFDALNREVEQNSAGTYTQIIYSPIGKIATANGQTVRNVYMPLPGGDQALLMPGYNLISHGDWLGSMRFTSSKSGRAPIADIDYAPFGESSNTSAELNFTGQRQDTISGLYDFVFREYSPVQGRWISPDRAGFAAVDVANPQTWNRYGYAANSPLNARDFLGLESCDFSGDECPCDGEGETFVSMDVFSETCAFAQGGRPSYMQAGGLEGGGGGIRSLRRAEMAALRALLNPDCAGLIGAFPGSVATNTLLTMMSDSAILPDEFLGGSTTGTISLQTLQDPQSGQVLSDNAATYSEGGPASIFINAAGDFLTGADNDFGVSLLAYQAATLLHELGHAIVLNGGLSGIEEDANDPFLSYANELAVVQGCFIPPSVPYGAGGPSSGTCAGIGCGSGP